MAVEAVAGNPDRVAAQDIAKDDNKTDEVAKVTESENEPQAQVTKKVKKAEIIVITSGKGGVGKTTTSAAVALGLAQKGFKTVVIDFDVGLRNLDLVMGCERRVVYDLISLVNKEANIHQTLIKDKRCDKLFILPASQTRDKDALTEEGVEAIIDELASEFDYIICDSPAGIEKGALMAMHHADQAIVVTNPEVSSVRDSDRILGVLASKTKKAKESGVAVQARLLITRYSPQRVVLGEMLSLEDVQDVLSIPLLGVIPESKMVLQASNSGVPVTAYSDSDAGQAYLDAIDRFLGQDKPLRFTSAEKPGFFKRLFGGK
ncbi:MAG: septum site-determining protein MinD [Francisellaceae bacterium]